MKFLKQALTLAVILAAKSCCSNIETSEPEVQARHRTRTYPQCKNLTPKWMLNDTNKEIMDKFFDYEYQLRETCNYRTNFFIYGDYYLPSSCESLTVCNKTNCLRFDNKAMKTFYTIPRHCVSDNNVSDTTNFYLNLKTPFLNVTKFHTLSFFGSQISEAFKIEKIKITFNTSFAEKLDDELRDTCTNFSNLFLFVSTSLPTQCSDRRPGPSSATVCF